MDYIKKNSLLDGVNMGEDKYKKQVQDFIDEIETIRELNHRDTKFEDFKLRVEKFLEEMAIQKISLELRNFKRITFFRPRMRTKSVPLSVNDLEVYKRGLKRLELLLHRVINDIDDFSKNGEDYQSRIGF